MAEKKLSEELRHCLEDDACGDCQYHKPETKFICKSLLQKAYEVIKRYEEMFPCKAGDTVYEIQKLRKRIQPYEIISLKIGRLSGTFYYWEVKGSDGIYGNIKGFPNSEIGKTVFLTRQEAEDKLAEMEGKNGN